MCMYIGKCIFFNICVSKPGYMYVYCSMVLWPRQHTSHNKYMFQGSR